MTIQSQIDAAAKVGGGIINVPVGDFSKETVSLRLGSDIIIRGAGRNITIIPPIARSAARLYRCVLEDLSVDCHGGYIAIDWTGISIGSIRRVMAMNAQYGWVGQYATEINTIEQLMTQGITIEAVELYDSANQNTFIGGRFNAPLPINIIDSNGNTFVGCSLEGDKVQRPLFKRSGYTHGTTMVGVRGEIDGTYGPVWFNGVDQAWSDA